MAVKSTAFYKKLPLLLSRGCLLLPLLTPVALANQFSCKASATGGWDCSSSERSNTLPPRPNSVDPAVASTSKPKDKSSKATPQLASENKGRVLSSRSEDFSHLDWVPREKLTAAQLAEVGLYCQGSYIEPHRIGTSDQTPIADAPAFISANTSRYNEEKQISTLAGNVVLQQGKFQAEANEANLHRLDNLGELSGNVKLRDVGALIVGDDAKIQLDTGEARVDNAEFVVHKSHYRGNALYAKRDSDGIIRLKDGTFTRCEPSENTWTLSGNNIVLNRETGRGTATNAVLRAKNIPIMYTPYISFPIDKRRQTGFLMPSFSNTSDNGFTLTTPYYINLAPNYDATIYPQLMTKRGLLMEGEFRYLTESSRGRFAAAYLNDNGNDDEERKIYGENTDQRWFYSWQNTTGENSRLLAEVDYSRISDAFYFSDFSVNSDGVINQSYVNQKGKLTYRGESFTAALDVHAYQMASVLDVTAYDRLPQLTLNGQLPFEPAGLKFKYDTEYTRFERDLRNRSYYDKLGDYLFDNSDKYIKGFLRANGNRLYLEPSVSLPMESSWGYLTPSIQYMYTKYDLDLDHTGKNQMNTYGPLLGIKYKDSINRSVAAYKVDSGLYFDRNTNLFGTDLTQTLEPRAMYLYVPYKNQDNIPIFDTKEPAFSYNQLFATNRFSGRDRIGDTNQISLGLTNRLIDNKGVERQRISIGQAYYFADRKVQMPGINWRERDVSHNSTSPIATQYLLQVNNNWRLSADYNWDAESSKTQSGSVMLHYQPQDNLNKIFNIGYRYRNDSIVYNKRTGLWQVSGDMEIYDGSRTIKNYYKTEQTDMSFIWPIIRQWSVIGRWQYDLNRSRNLDTFGGIEYDSCCLKLRLVARRWQKYDENFYSKLNSKASNGVFLQVVFKGLGDIYGGKVNSFMDDGIEGYRKREDNDF